MYFFFFSFSYPLPLLLHFYIIHTVPFFTTIDASNVPRVSSFNVDVGKDIRMEGFIWLRVHTDYIMFTLIFSFFFFFFFFPIYYIASSFAWSSLKTHQHHRFWKAFAICIILVALATRPQLCSAFSRRWRASSLWRTRARRPGVGHSFAVSSKLHDLKIHTLTKSRSINVTRLMPNIARPQAQLMAPTLELSPNTPKIEKIRAITWVPRITAVKTMEGLLRHQ